MKLVVCTFALGLCLAFCTRSARASNVPVNDVVWSTLGQDENDSMPINNVDLICLGKICRASKRIGLQTDAHTAELK
jgi:hypothetical protein